MDFKGHFPLLPAAVRTSLSRREGTGGCNSSPLWSWIPASAEMKDFVAMMTAWVGWYHRLASRMLGRGVR